MEAFGITDTGVVRKNNEDSLLLNRNLGLFIVADGMGGHSHGEIASNMAVRGINEFMIDKVGAFEGVLMEKDEYVVDLLKAAIVRVHEEIFSCSQKMNREVIMGTTASLAFFRNGHVYMAHVGDSRIYRFRNDRLEKLTTDHNETQELVEKGEIREEDADDHWRSNILTRALGIGGEVTPEIQFSQLEPGDQFLLCSDGLGRVLNVASVAEVMREKITVRDKCQVFIKKALENGAPDNVTVVIVKIDNAS